MSLLATVQSSAVVLTAATAAILGVATTGFASDKTGVRYTELPQGAYAIVAEIRAKPGKEEELRQATLPLVAKVRAEPGNILYFLHENREQPGHFTFYEIFPDEAAFNTHNATEHVQTWFAKLPELADGDVKVTRMQILGN